MFNTNYGNCLTLQFIQMDDAFYHRNEREYEMAKEWICREHIDLKRELEEMKKIVSELRDENQKLLDSTKTLHKHPAALLIDDVALYEDWLQTRSFRQTGRNFGIDKDTVKRHLIRAGYIG